MGKKSLKSARKISKVYSTEELRKLLSKNDHFIVSVKATKNVKKG